MANIFGKIRNLNFSWDRLVAIVAMLTSTCALLVSAYETSIMKKQQYVQVWPYVVHTLSNHTTSSEKLRKMDLPDSLDLNEVSLAFKNKGLGPAILEEIEFLLEGKSYESGEKMMNEAYKSFSDGEDYLSTSFSSLSKGSVIMARAEHVFFKMICPPKMARTFSELVSSGRIQVNFRYRSLNGDCWWLKKGDVQAGEECR
ncbi:hypothetical protein FUAX_15060 [Fulvitalea axinellae]|uniref:DUF2939 domain-containing protein n=1 Tax=Fulvitalea axinellae TaxID=1182444 RepID=A0AAU9CAH8_9BACT|nr:hypothetical protein FUAX_15060 [Fulvitalea axinellae]